MFPAPSQPPLKRKAYISQAPNLGRWGNQLLEALTKQRRRTSVSQGRNLLRCAPLRVNRRLDLVRAKMNIEPEKVWLRPLVMRMRALLRYAKEPRVVTIVRELIGNSEERLELLEEIELRRLVASITKSNQERDD